MRRPGRDRRRLDRRDHHRPLPPVHRRCRAHAAARPRRVPVLDRVAAHPAGWHGPGQREGNRVLRPPDRRTAGREHPPDGDAVPLGHAPAAAGAAADGATATPHPGSPSTPRSRARRSAIASTGGSRSTSRRRSRSTATRSACTPPARRGMFDALHAAHDQLLGHGLAVQALRAAGVVRRRRHHERALAGGARERRHPHPQYAKLFDLMHNRIFADPVLLGRYPKFPLPCAQAVPAAASRRRRDDLAIISQPLDFYGLNYYMPTRVAAGSGRRQSPPTAHAAGDGGAPVPPRGLPRARHHRLRLADRAALPHRDCCATSASGTRKVLPPVYITEGGASFPDRVANGASG